MKICSEIRIFSNDLSKIISLFFLQAKPMLNFQTDYDESTGEQVLTCFLLPQMEYQQENMGKYFIANNINEMKYTIFMENV